MGNLPDSESARLVLILRPPPVSDMSKFLNQDPQAANVSRATHSATAGSALLGCVARLSQCLVTLSPWAVLPGPSCLL